MVPAHIQKEAKSSSQMYQKREFSLPFVAALEAVKVLADGHTSTTKPEFMNGGEAEEQPYASGFVQDILPPCSNCVKV